MNAPRVGAAIAAAVLVLVANSAIAVGPVAVSECGTVITEPGRYRVTQDLFCAPDQQGITVFASDVAVDLGGHAITCDASGEVFVGAVLIGEYLNPDLVVSNVRVRNGTVSGCDDGVIFFYTRSGRVSRMLLDGNVDGGITLLDAQGTIVRNNVGTGNVTAIRSWGGINNLYKHNSMFDNSDAGIRVIGETDSTIACNTVERNGIGVSVGEGSSRNRVRGNLVTDTAVAGLTMYGVGTVDEVFSPIPFENRISNNIVQTSGAVDLSELMWDPFTFEVFVPDGAECVNTWRNNQFFTEFGPIGCFGVPVKLDEKDVCAIGDDRQDGEDPN